MVFGLFARKPDPSPFQLHTPTPSISNSEPPTAPPPLSLSPPPDSLLTDPVVETQVADSTALYNLVRSVPPQTLHTYTLSHLLPSPNLQETPPSPHTLTALTRFFSTLSPPPQLHCVRCHASFFELSNTDTSCRVPHDDDSALVDRAAYETLWGCCGRTVEGTGDMGPPDGWCYEGRHTTDIKRARFREDSTIHDDKLVSCAAMGCHGRKRKRSVSASSDEMSTSSRKKDKGKCKEKMKPIHGLSPKSSTSRKPVSKTSIKPTSTPKPLSRTSSVTPARSRPLPKSHLHQSHIAFPTLDGQSESGSDAPLPTRHKSTPPCDLEPLPKADVPIRPTRERTNTNTNSGTRPIADGYPRRPRTRSAAREERSLSRPRASVRGNSVRILREHSGRQKEKEMSESDRDEKGRGRGREVKKRRVS